MYSEFCIYKLFPVFIIRPLFSNEKISLEVGSMKNSIQIWDSSWAVLEYSGSSYHRPMFPEGLVFRPAGSSLSNHLIPYLFVLFRSRLWSRPFVFCCQDGSLPPAAELAASEIKGRVDAKSSPSRGPLLFSVALAGIWWDTVMGTQRLRWQPCECSLQYLFVSSHVLLCQWLPQCHALVLAQLYCTLLW